MKRALDVLGAGLLLIVTLPVVAVLAIGLAISLRAWPLFTQQRIGRHGAPFRFVKLRTLPATAPQYADKYEISRLELPWFARVIRGLHLDELPQLALVLTGHMSLVGPRPEMPELHDVAPRTFAVARTRVRPGCTGLWQISEDARGLIHEAPVYDLVYVERRTLLLDAWILWRTALMLVGVGRPQGLVDTPHWALDEGPAPAELDRAISIEQRESAA